MGKCLRAVLGIDPQDMNVNPDTPEMMIERETMPSYDYVSNHVAVTPGITYHYIKPERMPRMQFRPGVPFPKIIHQFWIGSKPAPIERLRTCSELHPDWEYHLWTEKSLQGIHHDSKYQQPGSFAMRVLANMGIQLRSNNDNKTIQSSLPPTSPSCTCAKRAACYLQMFTSQLPSANVCVAANDSCAQLPRARCVSPRSLFRGR